MKAIVLALSACALYCVPGFAQATASGDSDQKFLDFAAQTDMVEAHLGQLAASQSDAQAVKDYAQMLVTDPTNDYQQLGMVAKKANLTLPNAIDAAHNKMIAPFEKLKGAAFDRRYEHEMVAGHTKAIAEYKKESESGTNADLKAYATQVLPTLEKHLQAAHELTPGKAKAAAKK
jgi:putative membrane protein